MTIEAKIKEIIEKNVWGLVCKDCGGGGFDYDKQEECKVCKGTGIVDWNYDLAMEKIIALIAQEKSEAVREFVKFAMIARKGKRFMELNDYLEIAESEYLKSKGPVTQQTKEEK